MSTTFVRNTSRSGVQRFGFSWFLHVDRQKHGSANKRIFTTVHCERLRKVSITTAKIFAPKPHPYLPQFKGRFGFQFQCCSLQYIEVMTQLFRTAYTQRFITWISRQRILLHALCTPQITWNSSSSNDAAVCQQHFNLHKVLNLTKYSKHNHSDRQPTINPVVPSW